MLNNMALSTDSKRELQAIILQQLTVLAETIQGLQAMDQPIPPDNAIGRLTRMDAINTRGANQQALKQTQLHHQQLQQALLRIDKDPDYGLCEECDEPIAIGRLKLVPEAMLCIECAV